MHRTPPFITPFAILSLIIILGASNVFENKVTHTNEGAPVRQTRVVNNQPRDRNVPDNRAKTNSDDQKDNQKSKHGEPPSNSGAKSDADSSRQSSASDSNNSTSDDSGRSSGASSNHENRNPTGSGNQSKGTSDSEDTNRQTNQ